MAEIGITLRNARIQRGLTIDQVAQETRISPRFLEALEAEAFGDLPAPVYVRGFLRSYANFLRLDATPLLDKLAAASGSPMVGPDGFVGGPPASMRHGVGSGERRPSANPFQRSPAAPPPPMMPQPNYDDGYGSDEVDEGWAPEQGVLGSDEDFPARGYVGRGRDDGYEVDSYPDETSRFRPRGVAGVLTERGTVGSAPANSARLLAVGGAVVLVLFVLLAVWLTQRGGDDSSAIAAAGSATPDTRTATVIAVGGTAKASTTAIASASAGASASPGNGTATAGASTASSTPEGSTATPTTATTPTPAPTATPIPPTPTSPPPTATPVPPTPTPAPILPSAFQFSECTRASNGEYDCGPTPYHVVCPAPGQWFVDVPPYETGSFPWKDVPGPGLGGVLAAGQGGCQ